LGGIRQSYQMEKRYFHRTGKIVWVRLTVSLVHDEHGAPAHFVSQIEDITERKFAEQALKASEERFAAIFRASPIAICLIRVADGVILDVNAAYLDLLGYGREEVIGKTTLALNLWAHREERDKMVEEIQKNHRIKGFETQFVSKAGVVKDIVIIGEEVKIGSEVFHVGIIQDVSARKEAEATSRQFEIRLHEAQRLESLGVLAGGIAHDFNNILTSILGNASLAQIDTPATSPLQEYLGSIIQGSIRASDLCKQMLAYSGQGRFNVKNMSLNQLVEETTQLLQLSISKKAVLRFSLNPELPIIEADATQLRQVIMNLVINASEAIGEKSGVIRISTGLAQVDRSSRGGTVSAPELPEGIYVYLEVSDSGCGMDADTLARIFDPFFTTKFTGRGLGLSAVLGIVRGHKGALKTYSEPGHGTTFKLLFPSAPGAAEAKFATPAAPAVANWHGEGCVLVAEDEESVRSTAALMLKRLGFEVALAVDGREAVEAFRAGPGQYSLVLMDLTMPHLDGFQAFAELQQMKADVQVVLMSGFNEQEALSRFNGRGLAGFLHKPFQFEELSQAVRGVMAGADGQPET
jgi:PAS domain S-box-containing protein